MSLNSPDASSVVARIALGPVSAANTAAATSGTAQWVDTIDLEGTLEVTVAIGALTGSVTGKLQTATDANGTGAADLTGYTHATISTAATSAIIVVPKNALTNRYLGYVGTVVTGPALISVTVQGSKKYS